MGYVFNINEVKSLQDYVDRVMECLEHPDALVTDLSTVGDFAPEMKDNSVHDQAYYYRCIQNLSSEGFPWDQNSYTIWRFETKKIVEIASDWKLKEMEWT
jgi:hypothetical protein